MGAVGLGQGNCRREVWVKEYEESDDILILRRMDVIKEVKDEID